MTRLPPIHTAGTVNSRLYDETGLKSCFWVCLSRIAAKFALEGFDVLECGYLTLT